MLIEDTTKWCWVDDELASEPFDTKKEALQDLKQKTGKYFNEVFIYNIGHPHYYKPIIRASDVIELIQSQAYNETEAYSYECNYFESIKDEHMQELEEKLTAVYQDWEQKHGYNFSGYIVYKDERI